MLTPIQGNRRASRLRTRLERWRAAVLGLRAERRRTPRVDDLFAAHDVILATMDEVVVAADERGDVRYANRAACELHRLSRADEFSPQMHAACGTGRVRRLDGTPLRVEDLPLDRAIREGATVREQFVLELPEGVEIFMYSTAVPLRADGRIIGAVAVARDVTELMQLDRLKDQFLTVAAHELKSPLAVIRAGAESLAFRGGANEAVRATVERIRRGVDRIDHVVTELLDVSQLRLGRFVIQRESLDLRDLVRQVVAAAPVPGPRHHVVVREDGPVPVWADRARIAQVVASLLSNAIRYSPEGGDVVVGVTRRAGEAVVSVRDHGVGIPLGRQAHVFERFYRPHAGTPRDRGGIGLGLYLSKEFVTSHGGRIWFESVEGEGSTFAFSLPC